MAKEKVAREEKVNVSVQEMLNVRPIGKKFSYSDRKKIRMKATAMRLQAGQVYEIFTGKADYLISKGVAEEVR